MRTGVTLSVTRADLERLRAVVKDRNAPQKHVWRAQIVLLSRYAKHNAFPGAPLSAIRRKIPGGDEP
jgi:hypothetical protein